MHNKKYYHKFASTKHYYIMATIYQKAADWVKTQNYPFTAEDFESYYTADTGKDCAGIIGGIFSFLHQRKLIKRTGQAKAKKKSAKGREIKVWISVNYSVKQREKRELPATKKAKESQTALPI